MNPQIPNPGRRLCIAGIGVLAQVSEVFPQSRAKPKTCGPALEWVTLMPTNHADRDPLVMLLWGS